MNFEYEITIEDFVAAQLLCQKVRSGKDSFGRGISPTLVGLAFFAIALSEHLSSVALIIFCALGLFSIYFAFNRFFPKRSLRRAYLKSGLAGQKFKTEVNASGFRVDGDLNSWSVIWPGASLKGEDQNIFVLYSCGTLYMWGKKYLNADQQNELRKMSGIS